MKKLSNRNIHTEGIKQDQIVEARQTMTSMIESKKDSNLICKAASDLMNDYKSVTGHHIDYSEDMSDDDDCGMY